MQYLLLIYGNEKAMLTADPETTAKMIDAFGRFTEATKSAGIYVGSNRLRPTDSAKTVRGQGGRATTVDGPFAETKEQLGGYYLIEAKDLDDALSWAARCPAAMYGAVEVRPVWPTQDAP